MNCTHFSLNINQIARCRTTLGISCSKLRTRAYCTWANKHDHSLPVATRNWTLLGFSVQCGWLSLSPLYIFRLLGVFAVDVWDSVQLCVRNGCGCDQVKHQRFCHTHFSSRWRIEHRFHVLHSDTFYTFATLWNRFVRSSQQKKI